jgi:hypothetical protein
MKRMLFAIGLVVAMTSIGCAPTTETSGMSPPDASPTETPGPVQVPDWAWMEVSVPGPVFPSFLRESITPVVLSNDEAAARGCTTPRVVYTELIRAANPELTRNTPYYGAMEERWWVDNCGQLDAYRVSAVPRPDLGAIQFSGDVVPDPNPDSAFHGFVEDTLEVSDVLTPNTYHVFAIDVSDDVRALSLTLVSQGELGMLETGGNPHAAWDGDVDWDHIARIAGQRAVIRIPAPTQGLHYALVCAVSEDSPAAPYRLEIAFDRGGAP